MKNKKLKEMIEIMKRDPYVQAAIKFRKELAELE